MADTIKIGNLDISSFKVGSADCSIYLGDVKLYPQTNLPYDAEIEYLESTGTQYIDTQINISGSLGIETEMYITSMHVPFGGRVGYMNGSFMFKNNSSNTFVFGYGNRELVLTSNFVGGNHSFSYVGNIVKYNNTTINCPRDTFVTDLHFILFGSNFNNAISPIDTTTRFYYFKLLNNGVLIRDYIPVRVGQTGYMYDKVSGQLFGNVGTGDFVLGNDII